MGNKLEEVRLEAGSSVESQGDQIGKRRGWVGVFRSRTDGETDHLANWSSETGGTRSPMWDTDRGPVFNHLSG